MGAFSPQSLAAQESIIQRCTDAFITKVGTLSQKNKLGINIVEWLEMNSFDLLGEMAFGENFGCIAEGKIPVALFQFRSQCAADKMTGTQRSTTSGSISYLNTCAKSF